MDLHDLSEELPVNWESIMNVARKLTMLLQNWN